MTKVGRPKSGNNLVTRNFRVDETEYKKFISNNKNKASKKIREFIALENRKLQNNVEK